MSEPFINVQQLSDYTGEDVGTGPGAFACAAASEIVRGYLGGEVLLATTVETRNGTGTDALTLRRLPVREVFSVTENDVLLTEGTDYKISEAGVIYRLCAAWQVGRQNIVVEYAHGFDLPPALLLYPYPGPELPLPEDIVAVTLALAKRILASGAAPVGGFTAETIGDYSYTLPEAAAGAFELDEGEKSALSRWRRAGVA